MSEVKLQVESFVADSSDVEIVNSIMMHIGEKGQLRQQLEAAEAELTNTRIYWSDLYAKSNDEVVRLSAAIREAREQKPAAFEHVAGSITSMLAYGNVSENVFSNATMDRINYEAVHVEVNPLFKLPVPAMPIQDDKPMPIETAPLEGEFLAERSNGEWLIVHNQKDVFNTGNRIVCHGESGRFWAAKRWMPLVKSEVKPS